MFHIGNKIPQNIFNSTIKSDFIRIFHINLRLGDFILKTKELLESMKQQSFKYNPISSFL